jgi:hypothetical protein
MFLNQRNFLHVATKLVLKFGFETLGR